MLQLQIENYQLVFVFSQLSEVFVGLRPTNPGRGRVFPWSTITAHKLTTPTMSTCSICMDSQINVIFTGCHHACCCQACADRLLDSRSPECPVCRATLVVNGSQTIYSLFYLHGVYDSPSSESESKTDSESELRDNLSEQSKQICELKQQLQSIKQKKDTKVESVFEYDIHNSSNVAQHRSPHQSPTIHRYRLLCIIEKAWKYIWGVTEPTTHPSIIPIRLDRRGSLRHYPYRRITGRDIFIQNFLSNRPDIHSTNLAEDAWNKLSESSKRVWRDRSYRIQ